MYSQSINRLQIIGDLIMGEQNKITRATPEEIRKDRQWLVAKSNYFIQKTRFNMDLMQQKIILHVISKIKPTDPVMTPGEGDIKTSKIYKFNYFDFCRLCGKPQPKGGKDFAEFNAALLDLRRMASEIVYIDQKGHERYTSIGWVSYYNFNTVTGDVEIELDRNLAPFLLELKGLYTTYPLLFILPMKSKYSVRLYELLKSYSYSSQCEIEIGELRRLLQNKYIFDEEKQITRELTDKEYKIEYTQFSDFNRFVLKKATEEINKNTDICVDYKVNRVHRQPVSITFFIHAKDKSEIDDKIKEINEFLDSSSMDSDTMIKERKKKPAEPEFVPDETIKIEPTTKLEYKDGASKPVLSKEFYKRLGEDFVYKYSDTKKEILNRIIKIYCTLGNKHAKDDIRIDGGNVFYIDLFNDIITNNKFREFCDLQVEKYSSLHFNSQLDKSIDCDKYFRTCVENDLHRWKEFIEEMKKKGRYITETCREYKIENEIKRKIREVPELKD